MRICWGPLFGGFAATGALARTAIDCADHSGHRSLGRAAVAVLLLLPPSSETTPAGLPRRHSIRRRVGQVRSATRVAPDPQCPSSGRRDSRSSRCCSRFRRPGDRGEHRRHSGDAAIPAPHVFVDPRSLLRRSRYPASPSLKGVLCYGIEGPLFSAQWKASRGHWRRHIRIRAASSFASAAFPHGCDRPANSRRGGDKARATGRASGTDRGE